MFNRSSTKLSYLLLCSLPLLLVVGLCYGLSTQPLTPAKLGDYSHYQCATGASHTGQTFRVLTVTVVNSIDLANRLCASSEMRAHYDSVDIAWHTRGFITAQDVVEQHYDLFLYRSYQLAGLVSDFERYYRPVMVSQPYSVYWLSRTETPELTQAYFANKRIGLLSDFYSQSFYLLPSSSLRSANIRLDESQKKLYHDLDALFYAFKTGEVDLITSPDLSLFADKTGPLFKLEIAEQAPPFSWFLRREKAASGLSCAVYQSLAASIDWMRGSADPECN